MKRANQGIPIPTHLHVEASELGKLTRLEMSIFFYWSLHSVVFWSLEASCGVSRRNLKTSRSQSFSYMSSRWVTTKTSYSLHPETGREEESNTLQHWMKHNIVS